MNSRECEEAEAVKQQTNLDRMRTRDEARDSRKQYEVAAKVAQNAARAVHDVSRSHFATSDTDVSNVAKKPEPGKTPPPSRLHTYGTVGKTLERTAAQTGQSLATVRKAREAAQASEAAERAKQEAEKAKAEREAATVERKEARADSHKAITSHDNAARSLARLEKFICEKSVTNAFSQMEIPHGLRKPVIEAMADEYGQSSRTVKDTIARAENVPDEIRRSIAAIPDCSLNSEAQLKAIARRWRKCTETVRVFRVTEPRKPLT